MNEKYKISGSVLKAENSDGSIRFRLISDALDRDGEVLLPKGAQIKNWKANPVWLWSHNIEAWGGLARPPIGKALMDTLEITDTALDVNVLFDEKSDPFAKLVADKHKDGFLNATSVGFIPITISQETVQPDQKGVTFEKYEVLEGSSVPVPSNPTALQLDQVGDFLEKCKQCGFNSKQFNSWLKIAGYDDTVIKDILPAENVRMNINYEITDLSESSAGKKTGDLDAANVKDSEIMQNELEKETAEQYKEYLKLKEQFDDIEKEGRVLSKKTRSLIQSSYDALGKLLETDQKEEPEEDEINEEKNTILDEMKNILESIKLSNDYNTEDQIINELTNIAETLKS